MGKLFWGIIFFSSSLFANYDNLIREKNFMGKIDSDYLIALMWVESRMIPTAISNRACIGLMQIHLDTAKDMGYRGTKKGLLVPTINVEYSIRYIYWLHKIYEGKKDAIFITFDAYNRGIGNVQKYPYKGDWKNHRYVGKIIKKTMELKGEWNELTINRIKKLPKL